MIHYLDFEKPLAGIEGKSTELRAIAKRTDGMDIEAEAEALDKKARELLVSIYRKLTPWQKCQVARHPNRPLCKDYVAGLFDEVTYLAGDRSFSEDKAILGGMARFSGRPIVFIGHEKGANTKDRIYRNFGMARPEGYRKAIRLMRMADKFNLPLITLVDTPGAYPGRGAEERGQAEAIARSTQQCLNIGVPIISIVTGEGGSGGAIAIATANHLMMLEHSIFSVISPEGCASILWKNADKMREAAMALKLTAQDLNKLGIADSVIPEPIGGAQRVPQHAIKSTSEELENVLKTFDGMSREELINHRYEKFMKIGCITL